MWVLLGSHYTNVEEEKSLHLCHHPQGRTFPSPEINMVAYRSTLENPLCNNSLQLATTESHFYYCFRKLKVALMEIIPNPTVNKEGTFLLLIGCFIQIWPRSGNVTIYDWFWHSAWLVFVWFFEFAFKPLETSCWFPHSLLSDLQSLTCSFYNV